MTRGKVSSRLCYAGSLPRCEKASGMDPVGVVGMRNLFKQLALEGRTVLLSSHQLNEVQQACGTVTVVNRGRTVAEGTVEELTRKLQGGYHFIA